MKFYTSILAGLAFVAGLAVYTMTYIVDETEQALVLAFGQPIGQPITQAGLHFKLPYHSVEKLEKRVLNLDPDTESFLLVDQKPLQVDYYVRYRIADPLNFYKAVRTVANAEKRLADNFNAQLRAILGQVDLSVILSEQRVALLERMRTTVSSETQQFGVEILDVRIGKADLPANISENVFGRMKSERERLAAKARAEGQEIKRREESLANLEAQSLIAEAEREAHVTRGRADSEATTILNNAYKTNPEFFVLLESLDAYREALAKDETYMILSSKMPFFDVMKN